jgi:hypothetical protein
VACISKIDKVLPGSLVPKYFHSNVHQKLAIMYRSPLSVYRAPQQEAYGIAPKLEKRFLIVNLQSSTVNRRSRLTGSRCEKEGGRGSETIPLKKYPLF